MGDMETQTCPSCRAQGLVCTHLPTVRDGRIRLDREYTDAQLESSPYAEVLRDAVVCEPDAYRSGPGISGDTPWSDPNHDVAGDLRRFHAEAPMRHRMLAEAQAREAQMQAELRALVRAALLEAAGYPMSWETLTDEETNAKVAGLADIAVDVVTAWAAQRGSALVSDGRG